MIKDQKPKPLGKNIADEVREAKKLKQAKRPISEVSTAGIIWHLVKRHGDNITICVLSLAIGLIIGSRL